MHKKGIDIFSGLGKSNILTNLLEFPQVENFVMLPCQFSTFGYSIGRVRYHKLTNNEAQE